MISRRRFLQSATAAGVVAFGLPAGPAGLLTPTASAQSGGRPVLVSIFLRGGADALALVPAVGDPAFRPSTSFVAIDLADGQFGLHPSWAPLFNSISLSELTGVHAVHSNDESLSHFNAMALADRGNEPVGAGWMVSAAMANGLLAPLNNLSIGATTNPAMIGGPSMTVEGVSALQHLTGSFAGARAEIEAMWVESQLLPVMTGPALDLFSSIDDIEAMDVSDGDIAYPAVAEAAALREAARFIKQNDIVANIAINSGSINNGARWDTHSSQAGALRNQIGQLAESIAAFRQDLGDHWDRVLILIQSEFGRAVTSNNMTARGTQHGHAGAMLLLGGAVAEGPSPGRVVARDWPGIALEQRYLGRDLAKTTDSRAVLREVLRKHMGYLDVDSMFPTFDATANPEVGLLANSGLPGDVDSSGAVSTDDVNALLRHLTSDPSVAVNPLNGDLDGDGILGLRDAQLLAQRLRNGG